MSEVMRGDCEENTAKKTIMNRVCGRSLASSRRRGGGVARRGREAKVKTMRNGEGRKKREKEDIWTPAKERTVKEEELEEEEEVGEEQEEKEEEAREEACSCKPVKEGRREGRKKERRAREGVGKTDGGQRESNVKMKQLVTCNKASTICQFVARDLLLLLLLSRSLPVIYNCYLNPDRESKKKKGKNNRASQ
ncbi:hypothetical protein E2C01_086962 [Portunus trituberculatus]|uniref:Uncharacterized protein n=1 Tax=Portunus trituberculatus TaxID=210409 RepID=A0A5B7JAQ8_PORTR|nr:hypothetical protein [Portunus trituberculatus]